MTFNLSNFWRFCAHLSITSKEFGTVKLDKPYGPQRWFMHEATRALEDGIHDITSLKCRQIGLSTIVLALDLYWPFTHPGIDGTLVTHDEPTIINFRTQLGEYYRSLPKAFKPYSPAHNRAEFVFRFNRSSRLPEGALSRLQYQVAGTRQSGSAKLGRAKGNAYVHATEMAFWGDQQGYQSLRNALAETNPNRLYIWESTANGFNAFEEQWRIACRATTQRAVFVSWWAHEMYRVPRDSNIFNVYWGKEGKLTKEEHQLSRDVALLYGPAMEFVNGTKEISPEQIAWYRWYSEEKVADPDMVNQEMPWTEHQAFVTTGAQYFRSRDLTECQKRITHDPPHKNFRIEIQQTLAECKVLECVPKLANLVIFEPPVDKAQYVLGADPAFGSSDWADRFVVSVWRCYADRLEQAAEFCTPDLLPHSFAWVMVYLAGCYAPCAWNLEVNGPGQAVLGEIDHLRRMRFLGDARDRQTMKNFLGGMQEFLYSRPDQITRIPTARGTMSTLKEKKRYFDTYKGYFSRGIVVPHSRELLSEMKWVVEEPGSAPAGSSRHKDDRVVGACLATMMWHDKLRARLMAQGITYQRTADEPSRRMNIVEQMAARQRKLLGLPGPQ